MSKFPMFRHQKREAMLRNRRNKRPRPLADALQTVSHGVYAVIRAVLGIEELKNPQEVAMYLLEYVHTETKLKMYTK
jgi:hypothetical protein